MKKALRLMVEIMVPAAMLLYTGLVVSAPPSKGSDPDPQWADPASAIQGESKIIHIHGANFAPGATVRYLVADSNDASQITVLSTTYVSETQLDTEIQVLDTATVSQYDIEVKIGRRKGKGTTLFSVELSELTKGECNLDFEAVFFPEPSTDGLRSDGKGSYPAGGGPGFRLDTNGSQKLETKSDDRWVLVDFGAHGCAVDDPDNPWNPELAVGFCNPPRLKGIDLRIEHQVQFRPGLCSLDWGENAVNDSMQQTVVVGFLAENGGSLIDPNRKGSGPEPLKLNYGCQSGGLGTAYHDSRYDAVVTRISEWEWIITGEKACLETQLGYLWGPRDADGNFIGPIPWVNMPFGLHITDVNKP